MNEGPELHPDDELMAELLATGLTHKQTAQHCGVSSKTIQRKLKDPGFTAYVTDLRRARVATITAQLVELTSSAVETLRALLTSENERIRLEGARTVLRLGREYHHKRLLESQLADRIEQLDRQTRADEDVEEPEDA